MRSDSGALLAKFIPVRLCAFWIVRCAGPFRCSVRLACQVSQPVVLRSAVEAAEAASWSAEAASRHEWDYQVGWSSSDPEAASVAEDPAAAAVREEPLAWEVVAAAVDEPEEPEPTPESPPEPAEPLEEPEGSDDAGSEAGAADAFQGEKSIELIPGVWLGTAAPDDTSEPAPEFVEQVGGGRNDP